MSYVVEFFRLAQKPFGHGKEVYKKVPNHYPERFVQIDYFEGFKPKAGDIISMVGSSTQYGHVALVEKVSGNQVTIAEQWTESRTVRRATFTITNNKKNQRYIYGVARPKIR